MSFLTEEYEKLVHLIARAFAKTHGSEDPAVYADTVLEHAKALSADPAPVVPSQPEEVKEPAVETPVPPAPTVTE